MSFRHPDPKPGLFPGPDVGWHYTYYSIKLFLVLRLSNGDINSNSGKQLAQCINAAKLITKINRKRKQATQIQNNQLSEKDNRKRWLVLSNYETNYLINIISDNQDNHNRVLIYPFDKNDFCLVICFMLFINQHVESLKHIAR